MSSSSTKAQDTLGPIWQGFQGELNEEQLELKSLMQITALKSKFNHISQRLVFIELF